MISAQDLDALEAFMMGTGTIDGCWFGDTHDVERGTFWWRRRLAPLFAELRAVNETASTYQDRVAAWMGRTFTGEVQHNRVERQMRFLEEAIELVQAMGLRADQVAKVAEYVFGRPTGDTGQEIGGVMVTLAALCDTICYSMQDEGERELARIDTPEMRAKIAAKQVTKKLFGMTHDTIGEG
jgi:hypothetical protein